MGKTVVGAALLCGSRLLAAQRSYPAWARGMYEFPGGKVEGDESLEEALRRELREELALVCPADLPLEQLVNPATSDGLWPLHEGYRMAVYVVRFEREPFFVRTETHLSLDWVELEQISGLNWLPADEPIVAHLLAKLL